MCVCVCVFYNYGMIKNKVIKQFDIITQIFTDVYSIAFHKANGRYICAYM